MVSSCQDHIRVGCKTVDEDLGPNFLYKIGLVVIASLDRHFEMESARLLASRVVCVIFTTLFNTNKTNKTKIGVLGAIAKAFC
jgi:hypothetical protein